MSDAALTIDDLSVTYTNGHRALSGLSITLVRGESLGVVGVSGSGKTTLVRAILGLLPSGSVVTGRIEVDGRDLLGLSDQEVRALRGRTVGYVSQDPFSACDPLRKVGHHVAEAWKAHGERAPAGRIEQGLDAMGIADADKRMRQRPHQWSGGMLQRATTLAATVHDPVLTLADEPTSALDTELADGALELLHSTCTSLLVVTHDLALAARHTDRVVVLDCGRIVEEGPSRTVLVAPGHRVTRRLVQAASPRARSSRSTLRPAGQVVLRAEAITKTYAVRAGQAVTAVRPTSLELRSGEVVGIVGPSGSGKSTLLRLLAGMERPDAGSLVAYGSTVWRGSSTRPRFPRKGFVMPIFQDPVASLDPRWPLWRSITEPLALLGTPMGKNDRRRRAAEELQAMGIGDLGVDRLPATLSVGQCQRVAFIRALIAEPAMIAADEPTASLDVEMATLVSDLVRRAADRGAAALVVSHDETRLRSYADRVLLVRDGHVRADG